MTDFLSRVKSTPVVMDGGLGTLLESWGQDVSSELWSAKLLVENPEIVISAHKEFFEAGAEIAITSSYQASFEGLEKVGFDRAQATKLMQQSVYLARTAAEQSQATGALQTPGIVAASIGPYGAMLADGSEYRGDYGVAVSQLAAWHKPRIEAIAEAEPDLLAVETIPSLAEAEAVALALAGTGQKAWLSMTVALGLTRAGEPLREVFQLANDSPEIVAVGINCSHPSEVLGAIIAAQQETDKAILVYPNSGEEWDNKNRRWTSQKQFPAELIAQWIEVGADVIGGCCRVGPAEIRSVAKVLADLAGK